MSRRTALAVAAAAILVVACGSSGAATPKVTTVAKGLKTPWGIAFLPGGDALVSLRDSGGIVRIPRGGGTPKTVMTIPGVVHTSGGEGGLLGLAVSPHYSSDGYVFAYYTTARDNRIVRFKVGSTKSIKPILTGLRAGSIHDGGRIAFGPDGKLYAGVGEAGQGGLAQDPNSRNGKILRMNPDGSDVEIYSSGHRNVQGLAWDAQGRLWASEFGQNRFDELNLVRQGDNGGWPVVEGIGSTSGGKYTNPKLTWTTGEASPSGAAIIGRTLYLGALQGHAVLRVTLNGTKATKSTPIVTNRGASGPSCARPTARSGSRRRTPTAAARRRPETTGSCAWRRSSGSTPPAAGAGRARRRAGRG
jgi:glucose/arabinose dehydrogenase